tara:strand:- start:168 stop:1760 length:1593 start_codon:yes stop_codon:yes gene_type:complete
MSRFIPTPFNFNMNAEEKVLEDMKLNFDSILSPDESDSQYDNFNSNKGLLDIAKKGTLYGGTTYGAALGIRHGLRYATPITQRMAAPLEQASTRIEGYYKPGVGYKDKVSLLMEHWKKGGTPALTEYLEKYKNTPDPFGQTYSGGATPKNLDKLRQGISGRGGLFGLPGAGVQTSDEFKWAAEMEKADSRLLRAQEINNEAQITEYKKKSTKAKNMLRYEMQKTELIKHSFGKPINKARWKASGLGKIQNTTMLGSLGGTGVVGDQGTRVANKWIKAGGRLAHDTRITASQYTGTDHRTLIKNAKDFGSTYIKQDAPKALQSVLGKDYPVTRVKSNGIFKLSKQAHRMYEHYMALGMSKKEVFDKVITPWVESIKKNAIGNKNTIQKTNDMLRQFLKFHDFVDGKTKVNYSLVSTQQTVAGVNADIEISRGKGSSYLRGGKGKLHHKILVSDLYDVAGGAGSTTQKNLHMNIARSSSSGANKVEMTKVGDTRSKIYKAFVNKDTKKIAELFPKLSRKGMLRMARLLLLRR